MIEQLQTRFRARLLSQIESSGMHTDLVDISTQPHWWKNMHRVHGSLGCTSPWVTGHPTWKNKKSKIETTRKENKTIASSRKTWIFSSNWNQEQQAGRPTVLLTASHQGEMEIQEEEERLGPIDFSKQLQKFAEAAREVDARRQREEC